MVLTTILMLQSTKSFLQYILIRLM